MSIIPQEQVGWLDVPMDDLLAVHCREKQLECWLGTTAQDLSPALAQLGKSAGTSKPMHTLNF
jgi:hypothetical protein